MMQGNLGSGLMQQNKYIEAEDAYRRALMMAPDNNKMCNLGICLMKQGRLGKAKDALRLVKPAVVDGPRGVDSHLKAYERAQQMLRDLESETMNSGGDRVEQRKLFDAFLGSSALWQPRPCKQHCPILGKTQDGYANENANNPNIVVANGTGNSLAKRSGRLGSPGDWTELLPDSKAFDEAGGEKEAQGFSRHYSIS